MCYYIVKQVVEILAMPVFLDMNTSRLLVELVRIIQVVLIFRFPNLLIRKVTIGMDANLLVNSQ